MATTAFVKEW